MKLKSLLSVALLFLLSPSYAQKEHNASLSGSYRMERLDGKDIQEPNYFKMEKEWADSSYQFAVPSKMDAVKTVLRCLKELSENVFSKDEN